MRKIPLFNTLLLLLFLAFIGRPAHAQQFDSVLNILETKYPQEKVYIQYDRPYYNPGETIWFKAYLLSANMPSLISSSLYTELIDDKGNILQQKTLPVVSAGAASDFVLPDTMHSSMVYVRAYTHWMLNFDSSFIYVKPIRILAPTPAATRERKAHTYSITFFPEGGDLVDGIMSRVAFKANDERGIPIPVKGDILDSKNQKVISFASVHDGMGYFSFIPDMKEKYHAVWKDGNGVSTETTLPTVKDKGIVMNVYNNGDKVLFNLHRSEGLPASYQSLTVVAQIQQQPVYTARINMKVKAEVSAPIPTQDLSDGIMQITLFNADGQPLAERIVFVNHDNYSFITDLHATEKNLTKKARNVLQIDVGDTLVTNLSISVTDASVTPPTAGEETIFSSVLLSSDIKGYVHNPAYYFSSNEDSVRAHLDLVMMTNGWRRFKWEDALAGRWPVIKYLPQLYLTVRGRVLGIRESELTGKDLTLMLKTKNDNVQILTVPVNPKGDFALGNLFFFDTARLYYQFNNDKNKQLTSTASFDFRSEAIRFPYKPVVGPQPFLNPIVPDSAIFKKNERMTKMRQSEFFEGQRVKVLEGVQVKSRVKSNKEKMDEEYTSGFFSGGDGYTFVMADDPFANSSLTVLDYLRGKVAGLQIAGAGSNVTLSWRGGSPSVFLNEMNSDIDMVQSTPMSDVAMIKVFRPPFFGAAGGGSGGAIAIYTKKGEAANSNVKGLDFTKVNGYAPVKEFYSPNYSADSSDKTRGDYRTTLYWNPYLLFDKTTRRISLPFYNNDNGKRLRVVIEGLNEAGKLTHEEKFFE